MGRQQEMILGKQAVWERDGWLNDTSSKSYPVADLGITSGEQSNSTVLQETVTKLTSEFSTSFVVSVHKLKHW
jgi:hypothetical protein